MASWSLDDEFVNVLHTALKLLHRERKLGKHPLVRLAVVEEWREANAWPDTALGRAAALRRILEESRQQLAAEDAEAAVLLESRFWRGQGVAPLADEASISESTFYARQSQAITLLARALWQLQQEAEEAGQAHRRHRLRNLPPATYTRLFGFGNSLARLHRALTAPTTGWVVSIEGLGGLGKTALAHRLATWAAGTRHFADIVWETARQEQFAIWTGILELPEAGPAMTFETLLNSIAIQLGYTTLPRMRLTEKEAHLRRVLKREPHLIVVDNLETAAYQEALLPRLWALANPSRFLLTSRQSLGHHAHVLCITLSGLNQADSLALIRYEGEERGVPAVAEAGEDRLHQIYAVTGGHPLAIKLVVGQARSLPLERALRFLEQAEGRRASDLYRFIYWQSWDLLNDAAQHVLLAMPALAASGGY